MHNSRSGKCGDSKASDTRAAASVEASAEASTAASAVASKRGGKRGSKRASKRGSYTKVGSDGFFIIWQDHINPWEYT